MDTSQIIKIAQRRNAYWNKSQQNRPVLQLDTALHEWKVVATSFRHTRKGDCKHTNGCTEVKQVCLIVDAYSGKVKSKTKQKKLYYNYE